MTEMRMRYVLAGIGVLVLAAALAIPALAQRGPGGPGGMGPGMMGFGWGNQVSTPVTTIDAAAARVREALAAVPGNGDLVVAEVMEFSNHFYVLVKEKSTGTGALELIVERNGFVHLEYGPAMMWNTKYGHMTGFRGRRGYGGMMGGPGMMGGGYGPGYGPGPQQFAVPGAQQITKDRAKQIAGDYLTRALPGTTLDEGTAFYGYFTFDIERAGKPIGMLSVNAFTGQVWYHNWHGTFVQEKEF